MMARVTSKREGGSDLKEVFMRLIRLLRGTVLYNFAYLLPMQEMTAGYSPKAYAWLRPARHSVRTPSQKSASKNEVDIVQESNDESDLEWNRDFDCRNHPCCGKSAGHPWKQTGLAEADRDEIGGKRAR